MAIAKTTARKAAPKKATAKKATAKKATAKKATAKKATAKKPVTRKKTVAKTTARKTTAKKAVRRSRKSSAGVSAGDGYVCAVCGLSVIVDEECGCIDTCDIVCCGQQMEPRG